MIQKTAKTDRIEALRKKVVRFLKKKMQWLWVKYRKIDGINDATVMAIQDVVMLTRIYQKVIGVADVVDKINVFCAVISAERRSMSFTGVMKSFACSRN